MVNQRLKLVYKGIKVIDPGFTGLNRVLKIYPCDLYILSTSYPQNEDNFFYMWSYPQYTRYGM